MNKVSTIIQKYEWYICLMLLTHWPRPWLRPITNLVVESALWCIMPENPYDTDNIYSNFDPVHWAIYASFCQDMSIYKDHLPENHSDLFSDLQWCQHFFPRSIRALIDWIQGLLLMTLVMYCVNDMLVFMPLDQTRCLFNCTGRNQN